MRRLLSRFRRPFVGSLDPLVRQTARGVLAAGRKARFRGQCRSQSDAVVGGFQRLLVWLGWVRRTPVVVSVRRTGRRSSAILFVVVLSATRSLLAVEPPPASIDDLVSQLASSRFIERQLATEQLCALGAVVADKVTLATESDDAEVRFRAAEVLRVIHHDARRRTVEAFVRGQPLAAGEQLPGWELFQQITGPSPATRQLYVGMLEDEWQFLDVLFATEPGEAPYLIEERVRRLDQDARQRKRRVSISSLCAVMLAACREDLVISRPNNIMLLCYRAPDFDAAVRNAKTGEPLQRLLGNLIARPTATDALNQSFHFALNYNLKEGPAAGTRTRDNGQRACLRATVCFAGAWQVGG